METLSRVELRKKFAEELQELDDAIATYNASKSKQHQLDVVLELGDVLYFATRLGIDETGVTYDAVSDAVEALGIDRNSLLTSARAVPIVKNFRYSVMREKSL